MTIVINTAANNNQPLVGLRANNKEKYNRERDSSDRYYSHYDKGKDDSEISTDEILLSPGKRKYDRTVKPSISLLFNVVVLKLQEPDKDFSSSCFRLASPLSPSRIGRKFRYPQGDKAFDGEA